MILITRILNKNLYYCLRIKFSVWKNLDFVERKLKSNEVLFVRIIQGQTLSSITKLIKLRALT